MAIIKKHGEESQFQNNLIKGVNLYAKSEFALIKNGMCYMLTLYWILLYLHVLKDDKTTDTANTVFDDMTGNIELLEDVAKKFSDYKSNVFKLNQSVKNEIEFMNLIKTEASMFVKFLSNGTRVIHSLFPTFSLSSPLPANLSLAPQTEAYFILFSFDDLNGKRKGHAIGMIANANNDFYIYDPNAGIYHSDTLTDVFTNIVPNCFSGSSNIMVDILLISKAKQELKSELFMSLID